jgi:hypothetical protein
VRTLRVATVDGLIEAIQALAVRGRPSSAWRWFDRHRESIPGHRTVPSLLDVDPT